MKRKILKAVPVLCLVLLPWLAIGALEEDRALSSDAASSISIKVGVYNGDGVSAGCVIETFEALRIDAEIIPSLIGPNDIYTGGLDEIDVIIFPGGSGSRQKNSLGSGSHGRIRDFALVEGKGISSITTALSSCLRPGRRAPATMSSQSITAMCIKRGTPHPASPRVKRS